jgi:hypothetical protein
MQNIAMRISNGIPSNPSSRQAKTNIHHFLLPQSPGDPLDGIQMQLLSVKRKQTKNM